MAEDADYRFNGRSLTEQEAIALADCVAKYWHWNDALAALRAEEAMLMTTGKVALEAYCAARGVNSKEVAEFARSEDVAAVADAVGMRKVLDPSKGVLGPGPAVAGFWASVRDKEPA